MSEQKAAQNEIDEVVEEEYCKKLQYMINYFYGWQEAKEERIEKSEREAILLTSYLSAKNDCENYENYRKEKS